VHDPTLIRQVALKNYKSIARCDVRLGPLMFLVGPNGSGKSNFLDALRFVSDALNTSLDHALRDRGGIQEVRRRSEVIQIISAYPWNFNFPTERRGDLGSASARGLRGDMRFNRKSAT
jgi:predicted ATPase